VIRIAALGDCHVGLDSAGTLAPALEHVAERADALLIAGDLTRHGNAREAAVFAEEVCGLGVPVVVVLGNHDHNCDQQERMTEVLTDRGIHVLEGTATVIDVDGECLGVAGTKGFGGGFVGACASEYGEWEMKSFVRHTKGLADRLSAALAGLDTDWRVALLHYSPVEETLRGERPEIYPFLGSYLLAEAVDAAGADLVVHGHAHRGTEKGMTPGGVPVRNVAQPVIQRAYHLFCLDHESDLPCEPGASAESADALSRSGV
jgi:Icc-related predicted phosphoesterase